MGLAERRKIKELQDNTIPEREKEIVEICGASIKYDIDWNSLADDPEGLNYLDNVSCHRLNMALRVISMDDMGKEALRDGLKSVKLVNVKDLGAVKINFAGGVLEMDCAYAKGLSGAFSDNQIREVLMKGL